MLATTNYLALRRCEYGVWDEGSGYSPPDVVPCDEPATCLWVGEVDDDGTMQGTLALCPEHEEQVCTENDTPQEWVERGLLDRYYTAIEAVLRSKTLEDAVEVAWNAFYPNQPYVRKVSDANGAT